MSTSRMERVTRSIYLNLVYQHPQSSIAATPTFPEWARELRAYRNIGLA